MRRYLLDTTPLSAYLRGRPAAVERFGPWLDRGELATSVLVYAEAIEWLRSRPSFATLQQTLRELLTDVYPYWLTYTILERYSLIRRQLRPPYGPGLNGDIDALIAATALERNLTVVTCDADYVRVPDLKTLIIPRGDFQRSSLQFAAAFRFGCGGAPCCDSGFPSTTHALISSLPRHLLTGSWYVSYRQDIGTTGTFHRALDGLGQAGGAVDARTIRAERRTAREHQRARRCPEERVRGALRIRSA